jgi:GNAT superfamily N-acetyltransferase
VLETYQGRGLGTWLIETVCSHPDLQNVRRFFGNERCASALRKFGFTPLADQRATWKPAA